MEFLFKSLPRCRDTKFGRTLLLSASGLVMAMSGTNAFAQGATTESVSDSGGAGEVGFGDIIVTANRREQKLQDVPIAISAVTAQAAEQQGVTGTASLQTVVPNLIVTRQANQAQPYLRGLGAASGNPNAEPSVALYVDGVYHPSANANFFDFNNIERIEVLKGPQGTLFGRNATGGVIQVITKDPGDRTEVDFKVGYANYQTVTANAYLSAPITDTLGANIALLYKKQNEGWGKNIFTGRDTLGDDNFGVRAKFVWSGEATTIRLSGDYSHTRNGSINGQNPPGTTNVNLPLILADLANGGPGRGEPFPGKYNTNDNFQQRSNIESGGVSLRIEHDFDVVQLMSLSAYRKTTGFWTLDQDLSGFPFLDAVINQSARMYTQEVHLLSPSSSKLQWLAGVYYFNYDAGDAPQRLSGALFAGFGIPGTDLYASTKTTSFSAFAQATYPILENTNLTLGFRYTWEKIVYNGETTLVGTDFILPGIGGPLTVGIKDDAPTFRITLDHKFTPDIMAYVSFNRGRKSGGHEIGAFDQSNPGLLEFYDAEQVNAYEIGIKTELFDRKLRFNLGGFYYDFTNMQFQKIVAGSGFTFNAPNGAQMYGVEAELNAKVTNALTLNGSVGYLHTKIRDFLGAPNTCFDSASGRNDSGGFFCNGPNGLPDPANLIPFNAEGNRTPNSPEWSLNTGFVYAIPSSVGTFTFAGNAYYTTKLFFEIDNRTNNPAQWLFSASAKWTDASDHFSLSVWGRNLSNKYYYSQYTGQGGASDVAAPAAPREYGLTIGYKF